MPHSFIAGGSIAPARFVTASTTLNRTVTQSASTDKVIGIADIHTHNLPGTVGGVTLDDGFIALSGMGISVFDKTKDECWLQVGGTVAPGDFLKPDANGKGITASSDGDYYGARALVNGTADLLIKVEVIFGFRGA